jgi:UDP-N-acetyl-D-galactosamine dehydrogenase
MIREFGEFGMDVQVHDPIADNAAAAHEYGIALKADVDLKPADAVVVAVAHDAYRAAGWPFISRLLQDGRGVVMDVKGALDPAARPAGIEIWRL